MPRVKSQVARADLYKRGIKVPAKTKSGFRIDRTKPHPDGDTLFCRKGQRYFTWKFKKGGARRSTTYPRQSQLTLSEYMSQAHTLNEEVEDVALSVETHEQLEDFIADLRDLAQELSDDVGERRGKLEAYFPEHPTLELMDQRIEDLETWMTDLDGFVVDEEVELGDLIEDLQQIILDVQ